MKKIFRVMLILLLAFSMVGCGPPKEAENGSSSQGSSSGSSSTGEIETISDFSEALLNTQKGTEEIINSYEGMPILELFTPQMSLASGTFYELMNIDNKDGRYEGKLFMSDHDAFIEKKGNISNFGYDYVLKEDETAGGKTGDRNVEKGIFDSKKEYYKSEQFVEREGKKISSSNHEFQRLSDGRFLVLETTGTSLDQQGPEAYSNKLIYLIIGEKQYDFVIARADAGPDYKPLLLSETGELTKEKAVELFKSAGWTIEKTGGIRDGKLTVDE